MSQVISPEFAHEIAELTGRLEAVATQAAPLFERIGVARRVFNGITDKRPIGEIADLAAASGVHALDDAIDAHALAFEQAAYDPPTQQDEDEGR